MLSQLASVEETKRHLKGRFTAESWGSYLIVSSTPRSRVHRGGHQETNHRNGRCNNRFWDNPCSGCILRCQVQKTIHSDEHAVLIELLAVQRQARNLTQTDLAKRLGVPQSFVSKVERGERVLDVIEFARYVSAMEGDPKRAFAKLVNAMRSESPHTYVKRSSG